MFGLVLKSFVVGRPFRALREYTRYHKKLVQERARHKNRIEKLLQMNGFKLSTQVSIAPPSSADLLGIAIFLGTTFFAFVKYCNLFFGYYRLLKHQFDENVKLYSSLLITYLDFDIDNLAYTKPMIKEIITN